MCSISAVHSDFSSVLQHQSKDMEKIMWGCGKSYSFNVANQKLPHQFTQQLSRHWNDKQSHGFDS